MFAVLPLLLSLLLVPTIVVSLIINPAQTIPAQIPNTPQLQLPNGSLPALPISSIAPLPSNLSGLMLQCDAQKYGHGLRYSSCHDAYLQIPHLVDLISFGPRTQGNWGVRLPFRAYSSDGLCAVNIGSRSGYAISDKASWYNIAQAAFEILEECVTPYSSGGSLKNLGEKSNLIISILSYEPHVHCVPPRAGHQAPNVTLCDEISDSMDAATNVRVFGPAGERGVDVGLPRSLVLISPEGSCEVFVGTKGPLDRVAWFDVYVGARAVHRMCVDKGLGGVSTRQGTLGNVFVMLKTGS